MTRAKVDERKLSAIGDQDVTELIYRAKADPYRAHTVRTRPQFRG